MLFEDLLKGAVVAQKVRKMIPRSLRWRSKLNSSVNIDDIILQTLTVLKRFRKPFISQSLGRFEWLKKWMTMVDQERAYHSSYNLAPNISTITVANQPLLRRFGE